MVKGDQARRMILGCALAIATILWLAEVIDRTMLLTALICISALVIANTMLPKKRR
jgi:ABC-type cobalamin transport system permease subunit